MKKLPIPYFKDRQTGKVKITLNLTSHIDQILAETGYIYPTKIRSLELTDVLVDTIPMILLGLQPDLENQKLRLLPMNSEQSYILAL